MSNSDFEAELAAEREYVASLYGKLDSERLDAARALDEALRDTTAEPEARWQRQVSVDRSSERLHALRGADNGLCFGRIDDEAGNTAHIGRIGLFDETNGCEPLLVDWRAPMARPFYSATMAHPEGLARRRHLRTHGRAVTTFTTTCSTPTAPRNRRAPMRRCWPR
ncbi:DNA helicase IV [Saccharopolyspora lacisalsi]|uniref:DNA helicase IV n=1 Tax=Halosaccharopolyspora lacisalsi TaxID=1000566 RepID=A0A839E025_9PSEU|nr:hypothetical protein [Halosaccharopolyspora lacisalsi]MBA8825025.1 DNA helicase IV [Halosaccharopolyspora lacisalsi]